MPATTYTIYIIESFDGINDPNVGKSLKNRIDKIITVSNSKSTVRYFDVHTSKQLFNILELIKRNCEENDALPIIHFCMHGDREGLCLQNHEGVSYNELSDILSEIKEAAKGELLLIMDVCHGNKITLRLNPYLPSPFNSVLGSFKKIGMWEPLKGFIGLYKELIKTSKWNDAVRQFRRHCPKEQSLFDNQSGGTVLKKSRYKNFKPLQINEE